MTEHYLVMAVTLVGFGCGFLAYSSTGYDDSYITYWAAYALASFGDILNYNGVRLEQSSSLLLVLALAGLRQLSGMSMPVLGPLFSMVCGVLTIAATYLLARRLGLRTAWQPVLLLVASPYLVYWSFSGMETTLAALCAVVFLHAAWVYLTEPFSLSRASFLSGALGAYLLVRPESFLVVAAFLLALALYVGVTGWRRGEGAPLAPPSFLTKIATLLLATALLSVLLASWRYYYFGTVFPQPVMAKSDGDLIRGLVLGLGYVVYHVSALSITVPIALLLSATARVLMARGKGPDALRIGMFGSFVLAQLGFVLLSGGDWMYGARFLVPIVPALMIAAVLSLQWIYPQSETGRRLALAGLLVLAIADSVQFVLKGSTGIPFAAFGEEQARQLESADASALGFSWFETANAVHIRDTTAISALLGIVEDIRRGKDGPITVLSGQMGMVAYHLSVRHFGDVELIDRRALVSRHFSDCAGRWRFQRDWHGLGVEYHHLFGGRPDIWGACGVARPDIIFDLLDPDDAYYKLPSVTLLERHGYTLVYRQDGQIKAGGYVRIKANEAVLVRNELIHLIAPERYARFRWGVR